MITLRVQIYPSSNAASTRDAQICVGITADTQASLEFPTGARVNPQAKLFHVRDLARPVRISDSRCKGEGPGDTVH